MSDHHSPPSPEDLRLSPSIHLVAAARAALASMTEEMGPLLQEELARLARARDRWRAGADTDGLKLAAHDLRGLGALYGAPLAGRLGASLERLLAHADAPAVLVDAHVDAIRAVVRERAADAGHPRGLALAAALEAAVSGLLGAAAWPQAA